MRQRSEGVREAIVKSLRTGEWFSHQDLSARLGISYDRLAHYLNDLTKTGAIERKKSVVRHIDDNASSMRFVYRLAGEAEPETPANATPPAYRNLRLNENLIDYESSLFAFAGLCMMVRK